MPSPWSSTVLSQGKPSVSQYKHRKPAKGDTPPERLNPQAQDVPDDPIRMQEGFASCRTCGVAVQTTDEADVISIDVAYAEGSAPPVRTPQNPLKIIEGRTRTTLSFALCPSHQRTEELAAQLVDSSNHPSIRERMNCALDALSFVSPRTVEHTPHLDAEGRAALVRHLAQLGIQARWTAKFSPVITPGADPQTCTRYAWAHLGIGLRSDLRTAYAKLLKERAAKSAPAVPIAPPRVGYLSTEIPITGGCLFCGVSHQLVDAATVAREGPQNVARDVWTSKRASTELLGGQRSPTQLCGHLCGACNEALDHVGAMGPSALERALVAHLVPQGLGRLGYGEFSMTGLVGYGALVAEAQRRGESSPEPGRIPWEHLPNLPDLAQQLTQRLG